MINVIKYFLLILGDRGYFLEFERLIISYNIKNFYMI